MNPLVVAIVPARSGSKSVPDKNIREVGGFSLLNWAITVSKKSDLISDVYVSTDSQHYADIALAAGAKVPFLRPSCISGDSSKDYEFISHAVSWFHDNNLFPDFIAHVRPTSPLRFPSDLDQAIAAFVNTNSYTSSRSVHKMSESAYKCFELSDSGTLTTIFDNNFDLDKSNNARQSFPETYVANGCIDIISVKHLTSTGTLHGNNVLPFITNYVHEIDNESDFQFLDFLITSSPEYLDIFK